MIEQNSTFFSDGPDSGKEQTFLTPGVVFGMFQIADCASESVAVSRSLRHSFIHAITAGFGPFASLFEERRS